MYTLAQLEKQQIGLRLHSYLVDELDEMTKLFSVNRTEIIAEAIKSYISEQKANMIYDGIEQACCELKTIRKGKKNVSASGTLDELIGELESN